jgi:hypothetical protein
MTFQQWVDFSQRSPEMGEPTGLLGRMVLDWVEDRRVLGRELGLARLLATARSPQAEHLADIPCAAGLLLPDQTPVRCILVYGHLGSHASIRLGTASTAHAWPLAVQPCGHADSVLRQEDEARFCGECARFAMLTQTGDSNDRSAAE